MNMNDTIKPKSDQLNADDLIGGNLTIKIRDIKGTPDPAQPVSVYFENDDNKPYKPCKSMRRLLVSVWGADGTTYIGRSITLYREDDVNFGGIKVGGIRISHVSHITEPKTVILTVSKTKRSPFKVGVIADNKEELTPAHKLWGKITEALKDGSRTIEQIKEKFNISEANLLILNK